MKYGVICLLCVCIFTGCGYNPVMPEKMINMMN